jgi:Domain of unknown function (DUF4159)
MRRAVIGLIVLAGLVTVLAAMAQDPRPLEPFGGRRAPWVEPTSNEPFDGRVNFVRIRYQTSFGGFGRRGGEPGWAHDYPTADTHLMKILNELTLLRPRIDGSNVYSLADPDLHNHPIAYMSEPGGWLTDDEEAKSLRSYLEKGGFIIFDDFRDYDWDNLVEQMRRVLPEGRWVELDSTHPVFHSFFEIDDLSSLPSYGNRMPTYWGMFEENDPGRRLIALANRDNDIGEYWEFSDTGYAPVDLSNQAYKFGVNYFIYGLTH